MTKRQSPMGQSGCTAHVQVEHAHKSEGTGPRQDEYDSANPPGEASAHLVDILALRRAVAAVASGAVRWRNTSRTVRLFPTRSVQISPHEQTVDRKYLDARKHIEVDALAGSKHLLRQLNTNMAPTPAKADDGRTYCRCASRRC
jgi:hypothetical protein